MQGPTSTFCNSPQFGATDLKGVSLERFYLLLSRSKKSVTIYCGALPKKYYEKMLPNFKRLFLEIRFSEILTSNAYISLNLGRRGLEEVSLERFYLFL